MIKLSVLIPTYNRADSLDRTLESLSAQTYYDKFLCLISDNKSTDNTKEVIEKEPRRGRPHGPRAADLRGVERREATADGLRTVLGPKGLLRLFDGESRKLGLGAALGVHGRQYLDARVHRRGRRAAVVRVLGRPLGADGVFIW